VTALACHRYEGQSQLARGQRKAKNIKEVAIEEGMLTPEQFDELVSPEAVCRLGSPSFQGKRNDDSRGTEKP
jgi:fumarate hydratase class II